MDTLLNLQALPAAAAIGGPAVAIGGVTLFFISEYVKDQKRKSASFPPPPNGEFYAEVPGLPVIGNLLQLKEKKPHKTFTRWAQKYGPIYSLRAGSNSMVVLNTNDVAKEAMVTKYSSISSRKLSNALKILTSDKSIVAMSDYDEFYKVAKRHLLTSTLGPNAQKRHRIHRDVMINNICDQFHAHAKSYPSEAVNFRKIFQSELFGLSMKQAIGEDVESIYVEDLGTTFSRQEIFKILVLDPMEGAIDVDWRDFFPFLKWIPNQEFENKIQHMYIRREAVMKALIHQQKKRIYSGKEINCYLDHLLSEADSLSEQQILMLLWEAIIEASDTTLVTTEWAMYELSKDPDRQSYLLSEIQNACGFNRVTEEKLCQLPYLAAVFHETLRKHSPVPIVPLRYVHEETQLGGYNIPEGSEIAINIYGCNMDQNVWDSPEEWKPERFLLSGKNDATELHKTMAFGGGKRVCAGALQAMTISCIAISRFVQEFEWRLKDGEEADVDTLGLTTHKLHPLLTNIKPRHEDRVYVS